MVASTGLAANEPMCHLLHELGAAMRLVDGQTLVFDVPLPEPADVLEREPSHPLRRLFRTAAQSLGMAHAEPSSPEAAAPEPEPDPPGPE